MYGEEPFDWLTFLFSRGWFAGLVPSLAKTLEWTVKACEGSPGDTDWLAKLQTMTGLPGRERMCGWRERGGEVTLHPPAKQAQKGGNTGYMFKIMSGTVFRKGGFK
jgi:hypothetical protein